MHLPKYKNVKTIFTIHNIEYQGNATPDFTEYVLGVDDHWRDSILHNGQVNAVKAGITLADRVTTVSETYAHEIKHAYYASGLEDVINDNAYKLSGIINGIDNDLFSPEKDKNIAYNFNTRSIFGKNENKKALRNLLGLEEKENTPIVAIISRLASHKGMELFESVWSDLLNLNIQLALIGTGDKRYEDFFRFLEHAYPGKVSSSIMFDLKRASMIYAGADFLLMPSKSEPCGLSQLIAMRYGTIPIVRETGGLYDTVKPINLFTLEGSGFTFKTYNAHDMLDAVKRATEFYNEKDKLWYVRRKIMEIDNSWENRSKSYIKLYKEILN